MTRITQPLWIRWAARRGIQRDQWRAHAHEVYPFGTAEEVCIEAPSQAQGLPSAIQEKMGRHVLTSPTVASFEQAILRGPHAIGFTRQRRVILETVLGRRDCLEQSFHAMQKVAVPNNAEKEQHFPQVCSLVNLWSHNYFHWLLEGLTRLEGYEHYCIQTGTQPFLLIESNPPTWKVQALQCMGYPSEAWTTWDGGHAQVDRLIVPSFRREAGITSPAACRWIRTRIASHPDNEEQTDEAPPKRIYISRAQAKSRRIVNEEEVMASLAAYGFERYVLEELSFRDQVRLFQQAEAVVAPHGAGLANILFSERLTVLEIFGDSVNPCYYTLASVLGYRYGFMQAITEDSDLRVDLDKMKRVLNRMVN